MAAMISPVELKARIAAGAELAILDVREEGAHSQGHPFYAAPVPLGRLELMVLDMVPRKATPVVLVDDGTDLSRRAATRMAGLGYTEVAILEGGAPGWEAAGFELFSGVHVPSKAFGEYVEHHYGTPHIDADTLKAMMDGADDFVILDSRPFDEFAVMSIPGGIDVPGAELAYRVRDIAPDSQTTVVVNCAGRTRSIIGAQSLINAGIPNRVVALENGTMGWHLAGHALEHGESRTYGSVSEAARPGLRESVERLKQRFGVEVIDHARLEAWRAEADTRSLYLLDVRAREDYEAGHLPGSGWAPGGQLVQETETWVATLGGRIVLIDDAMVRAVLTASWLVQSGWGEVAVLDAPFEGRSLEQGPWRRTMPAIAEAAHDQVSPEGLRAMLEAGEAVVVDLAPSAEHEMGHVPGAWYAVRAHFPTTLAKLPGAGAIVLTSPDGILARLAAPEASELTARAVKVLAGGTHAWRTAGGALEEGLPNMADARNDAWLRPYQQPGDVEERMRAYLTWEGNLVAQIARDGDHRFRLFPEA